MARFISVCRASISNNSTLNSQTAVITGSTNSSGVPASTYGVILSILASNKNANSQNVTVNLVKGGTTTTSLITWDCSKSSFLRIYDWEQNYC